MTKSPMDLKKVYLVISTFTDCFMKVDARLKKQQLILTATGEELHLGSLDWMDLITELEAAFNITINPDGLFGCNVQKLLHACTEQLVKNGTITNIEEVLVFQKYPDILSMTKKSEQYSALNVAKLLNNTRKK